MSKLEKDSERISAYIFDIMEPEERLVFEEDLNKEKDLASEYRFQMKVHDFLKKVPVEDPDSNFVDTQVGNAYLEVPDNSGADIGELIAERMICRHEKKYPDGFGVTDQERAKFRNLLRDVDPDVDESNDKVSEPISLRKWFYPLAAAAAIIIAILVINSTPWIKSPEALFNKYYQPFNEANFVDRKGVDEVQEAFQKAVQFYRNEDFVAASMAFRELAEYDLVLEDAVFFLGLSLLGEGLYNEAADQLEVYLSSYSLYDAEASWYLALCYLKLEDFEKCDQQLQGLTSSPRRMGRDANELLRRLRNRISD